jgi:hypothetical protein
MTHQYRLIKKNDFWKDLTNKTLIFNCYRLYKNIITQSGYELEAKLLVLLNYSGNVIYTRLRHKAAITFRL